MGRIYIIDPYALSVCQERTSIALSAIKKSTYYRFIYVQYYYWQSYYGHNL